MSAELLAALLNYAVKYGPAAVQAIIKAFHKPAPTVEDWTAAFKIAETPYEDYVVPTTVQPAPQ